MENQLTPDLVSIITPAFNSANYIAEAINSVQRQTYSNWEHIVVIDSGTTDNTTDIVKNLGKDDNRIKLIEIKDKRGISLSRNAALKAAKGEWIAFLDSDDFWLPHKLSHQIEFMKANSANFSCTGYRKISEDGLITGKLRNPPFKQTYHSLLGNNLVSCPTVVYNQKYTGRVEMKEYAHEDYILWLEIIKKTKICYGLQEDLARYRIVQNSRSMNVNRSGSRWVVFRKYENLSFLSSCYYFFRYAITAVLKRSEF